MAGSSNFGSWLRTTTASAGPRPICSAASSGQATSSRSTSGKRSRVAKAARASMTTVSKPSSRARRTRAMAMGTPPTTTSRGRTANTSRKRSAPATSRVVEMPASRAARPAAMRASSVSTEPRRPFEVASLLAPRRGPRARPPVRPRTGRHRQPGASPGRVVMIDRAPALHRPPSGPGRQALRAASSTDLRDARLDQHIDDAATGQPHGPGLLVGDPEAHEPLVPAGQRLGEMRRRGALDAAAADGAGHAAVAGQQHRGALPPRGGAVGAHDDGAGDVLALRAPGLQRRQDVLHVAAQLRSGARARQRSSLVHPRLARPVGSAAAVVGHVREQVAQLPQAGQVVDGHEVVDEGIGRLHAAGQGLVDVGAEERVEPDEPMAAALQARHLAAHEGRIAAVPAVRDDEDDAARAQHPPRPFRVEGAQRLPDARSAGPVGDRLGDALQRHVRVAAGQLARDARQVRAEDEGLRVDARDAVQGHGEPDEEPGVPLHGAAHVADDGHRARPHQGSSPEPLGEVATALQVAPEHLARGEASTVRVERVAPRAPHLQARPQPVHEALGVAQLVGAHALEGLVEEALLLAPGGRRRGLVPERGELRELGGLLGQHGGRGRLEALALAALQLLEADAVPELAVQGISRPGSRRPMLSS